MRNKVIFGLLWIISGLFNFSYGQDSSTINSVETDYYQHQLEIGTDNDFFVISNRDRSYTFGVNAAYRFVPKEENIISKIFSQKQNFYHSVAFHLEAYTPNYDFDTGETTGERPFAGWSYATISTRYTFPKSLVTFAVDMGILGEASQAGAIQNFFHENISGDTVLKGWGEQIPNQFGINLKANYYRELYKQNWFDVFAGAEASIGNIRTYLLPEVYARIGKFNSIGKTASFRNTLFNQKDAVEYYLQGTVGHSFIAKDATLQGNIFSSRDDGRRFQDIDHTTFHARLGIYLTYHRWSLAAVYYFNSGEIDHIETHTYGSLNFDYRF